MITRMLPSAEDQHGLAWPYLAWRGSETLWSVGRDPLWLSVNQLTRVAFH